MITFILGVVITLVVVWFVDYISRVKKIKHLEWWKTSTEQTIAELWRQHYQSNEDNSRNIDELKRELELRIEDLETPRKK